MGRAWGKIALAHHHRILPGSRAKSALIAVVTFIRFRPGRLLAFGYTRPTSILLILLARMTGTRIITRSDSNWLDEADRPWLRTRLKAIFLAALFGPRTIVWTIGSRNDQYWEKMGFANRRLIPYVVPRPPVATEGNAREVRRKIFDSPRMLFMYVGRLEVEKGPQDLIRAFAQFKNSHPDESVALAIVGAGSCARHLRLLARDTPSIIFTGAVRHAEIGDYYGAADVLVVPSRREPWGLIVNEALANGLRVIASHRVGSADDLICTHNGRRFQAGNVDQLERAIAREATDGPVRISPRREPDVTEIFAAALR